MTITDSGARLEQLRRASLWRAGERGQELGLEQLSGQRGIRWFDLACGHERVNEVIQALGPECPEMAPEMAADLLTPDDKPEGASYLDGRVRLAASFSVEPWRPQETSERGRAQRAGVLIFQPVEFLAGPDWLVTCWHPRRTFYGTKVIEQTAPADNGAVFTAVRERFRAGPESSGGDLGVAVMNELALTYAGAHRALASWLEDWELSLYMDDELNNEEELPALWSLSKVLRDWLNPLNRPGLSTDASKAWLPVTAHEPVVEVDRRVDAALHELSKLSETLRQSFGMLHLEQAEARRRDGERMQHRVEIAAAVFLVPTLIVGFYGANTWVPGENKHWGFWVMVVVLVALSAASLAIVLTMQRRSRVTAERAAGERERMRRELMRGH
jgi:hypothetical protein